MQPNSEPSANDIAAVSAFLGGDPQPVAEPIAPVPQLQPEAPIAQPAPTQAPTDPFASLFASEPGAPTAPVEVPTPIAEPVITEVFAPAATPVVEPAAPAAPAAAVVTEDYQTYEDYMAQVLAGVPEVPAQPDPEAIDANDPNAIKGFFDDLLNTAVARAKSETARSTAIQSAEKQAWESAFDKFGTLRTNRDLRDMVHSIRMANFQKGIAMTPTQAAEKLLTALGAQYKQGVADNQVVTTYEAVQPMGGSGGTPLETTLDRDNTMLAVQNGGETALAAILDARIKAGTL